MEDSALRRIITLHEHFIFREDKKIKEDVPLINFSLLALIFNYFGNDDNAGCCLFFDILYFSNNSYINDKMNLTPFPMSIFKTHENSLYLFRLYLELMNVFNYYTIVQKDNYTAIIDSVLNM